MNQAETGVTQWTSRERANKTQYNPVDRFTTGANCSGPVGN